MQRVITDGSASCTARPAVTPVVTFGHNISDRDTFDTILSNLVISGQHGALREKKGSPGQAVQGEVDPVG